MLITWETSPLIVAIIYREETKSNRTAGPCNGTRPAGSARKIRTKCTPFIVSYVFGFYKFAGRGNHRYYLYQLCAK